MLGRLLFGSAVVVLVKVFGKRLLKSASGTMHQSAVRRDLEGVSYLLCSIVKNGS